MGDRWRRLRASTWAGVLYFLAVFTAGAILGPIRELWAVPRFGARSAELLEAPLMLAACAFAAGWVVRRSATPRGRGALFGVGLTALGLTLSAEWGVLVFVRRMSIAAYVASRDPVAGVVYLAMLGIFALMPVVVGGRAVKKGSL